MEEPKTKRKMKDEGKSVKENKRKMKENKKRKQKRQVKKYWNFTGRKQKKKGVDLGKARR